MRCSRCASEIPTHANFCLRCGQAASATLQGAGATSAVRASVAPRPQARSKTPAIAAAVIAVVALASFLGWKALANRSGAVTDKTAGALGGGALADRSAKVTGGTPVERTKTTAGDVVDTAAIMDYLKFLKEIERQRDDLVRAQLAQALPLANLVTASGISAELNTEQDPNQQHARDYAQFQQALSAIPGAWQTLSTKFLGYPKPVPQSCKQLSELYYNLLGSVSGQMSQIATAFSGAMGPNANPQAAIEALTKLDSNLVDRACRDADNELTSVCDKFRLTKEFDIKASPGGSSMFSGFGGMR